MGKCNRLDKCGYHYTPRQWAEDNPHVARRESCFVSSKHRVFVKRNMKQTSPTPTKPLTPLPERIVRPTLQGDSQHLRWLRRTYGDEEAERIRKLYGIGGVNDVVIFWQRDKDGYVRTGKVMLYDEFTGKRVKGYGTIEWVHSRMREEGALPEGWELSQCLYGEHLLGLYPQSIVAVVEAYKTANVGAILMPEMVWVAVDSLSGLTAEKLRPLKGRDVILFPDEGKGYSQWQERIEPIAREVGFRYRISDFMEGREQGSDIADLTPSTR